MAATNDTVAVVGSTSLLNVNMGNITKLTATNFLMWSRQVHALLYGYDLAGYIDGSLVMPPSTITTAGAVTANPKFTLWRRQDQLIYSALIGAIATTSAQVWEILSSTYAKASRGHVKQLKQHIKSWTKASKLIDEYVQGHTTRFDQLALLGKPLDHEDQVEFILEGLPEEYKQVIDQIEARDTSPSLTEVHEKLLNHEIKLRTMESSSAIVPISANVANSRSSNHNNYKGSNRFNNSKSNQTWQQQQFQPQPNYSSPRGYQGKCQICGVYGHSARRCSQLTPGGSYNNAPCPFTPTPWQPRANMASATPYNPNNWILDSGVTHHLTTDLNNLSLHQPYTGGEEVTIADGSALSISHTGE